MPGKGLEARNLTFGGWKVGSSCLSGYQQDNEGSGLYGV